MRNGVLQLLRRRGTFVSLVCAALILGPAPFLMAKMDPLRVVQSQIVRPNILIVLDTPGPMAWRPSDATTVGGDCYNGSSCQSGTTSNVCPDGSACLPAKKCTGGQTCDPGTAKFCASGSACTGNARICGTPPSATICTNTTNTAKCQDGTACGRICTDNRTKCPGGNGDCPKGNCIGATCKYSGTCGPDGTDCALNTCKNNTYGSGTRKCDFPATGPGAHPDCPNGSAGNTFCKNNYPNNCANSGACTNGTEAGKSCKSDDECGDFTCGSNSQKACSNTNSDTTCGFFCSNGTQCSSAAVDYCGSSGSISICHECPEGDSCPLTANCGADGTCPAPSSRMAIAKHVIQEVMEDTKSAVNYGFMAFNQSGYFPYVSGGSSSSSCLEEFWDVKKFKKNNGWDTTTDAPKSTFTANGTNYKLGRVISPANPPTCTIDTAAGNSTYNITKKPKESADHAYCGSQCVFSSKTWNYKGSYVSYTKINPSTSGTVTSYNQYYGDPCPTGQSCAGQNYFQIDTDNSNVCGPICGWSSGSSCSDSSKSDGRLLVDISVSPDQTVQDTRVTQIEAYLATQNAGGLAASGGTPTGCVLKSGITTPPAPGYNHDAYTYMQHIKNTAVDSLATCRRNYIILVTDGEPNGPGDSSCDNVTTCGAADPVAAGCNCTSVLAARALYNLSTDDKLRVKTYAVGLGGDFASNSAVVVRARNTLNNIAKAGGTSTAYFAADEDALASALQSAVYDAVKGDYSTSPPTIATSSGSTYVGDIALLASTSFPSFEGHLRAYDIVHTTCPGGATTCADSARQPTLKWDAGELLNSANRNALSRKIYTWNMSTGTLVPFIDTSGIPNGSGLLGANPTFAASAAEADGVALFAAGVGRTWRLGSLLNSTPVSVGKEIDIKLQGVGGHADFAAHHRTRYKMIYVGADDAMLHALYQETGPNGEVPGTEAWAFVPPDMLPQLTKLYVLGGQPGDPESHIWGMSSSPKVNDVCDNGCDDEADWRTILVGLEGKGGHGYFALDVTDPVDSSGNPSFVVKWTTGQAIAGNNDAYSAILGESWSVPAFAYVTNGSSVTESLILFGSGYGSTGNQGQYLSLVKPKTGALYPSGNSNRIAPVAPQVSYALLADTVVSLDPTWHMAAAYQVDLEGRLWRLNSTGAIGSSAFWDATSNHPFYYSPAVAIDPTHDTVLALNDSTYFDTEVNNTTWNGNASHTPRLYIVRDRSGTIPSDAPPVSFAVDTVCKSGCTNGTCPSGCPKFASNARPVGSPVLLKNTLLGDKLQALYLLYQPATACTLGASALAVFDVDPTVSPTTFVQSASLDAGSGAASGILVGAGTLMVSTSGAGDSPSVVKLVTGTPSLGGGGGGSCTRVMGMSELPKD